jgi:DNA-binding MarR family transcriptional regulator
MDLIRVAGLVQPDRNVDDTPLHMSQAFALHELDTEPPLSQQTLAERLRLDKSSVSRMAAEMERNGLLVRERDPDNRRVYRLRLTDRGRAAHRHLATAYHEQFQRWVAAMTAAERAALLKGLPALVRVVREHGRGLHDRGEQPKLDRSPASRARTSASR